jgi:hypothetical protein
VATQYTNPQGIRKKIMESTEFLNRIDRVKIVCEKGILQATKIYTQDGQEIRVTNLNLYLKDNIWMVDLTMYRAEIDLNDVLVGHKLIKCVKCKEVEEITNS